MDEYEKKIQQTIRYFGLQRDDYDILDKSFLDDLSKVFFSHKELRHIRHNADKIQRKQHNFLHLKEVQDELENVEDEFDREHLMEIENKLVSNLHRLKYFTPDELDKIIDVLESVAENAIDDRVKELVSKLCESYRKEKKWVDFLIDAERIDEIDSDYEGEIQQC